MKNKCRAFILYIHFEVVYFKKRIIKMTMNKLNKLVLTTALMMTAAFAHADVEKVTVINPDCLQQISTVVDALDAAHSEGKFKEISFNKSKPAYNDVDKNGLCNINLDVNVKKKSEVDKLQLNFRSYMSARLKYKMLEPTITKIEDFVK